MLPDDTLRRRRITKAYTFEQFLDPSRYHSEASMHKPSRPIQRDKGTPIRVRVSTATPRVRVRVRREDRERSGFGLGVGTGL